MHKHDCWVYMEDGNIPRSAVVKKSMKVADAGGSSPNHLDAWRGDKDDVISQISSRAESSRSTKWSELTPYHKSTYILKSIGRLILICVILFVYVCSLSNISTAFSLIASRGLGTAIKNSPLLDDPISAVVLGMISTVVLQSATTTISVLVGMIAANMITVNDAIPVMIGSELGSSLVNALVSIAYSGEPDQFRRAFSAATLGDVYNICCLCVILPLELLTSTIERLSWFLVDPLIEEQGLKFKTLDLLTDPVNNLILQVNEDELRVAAINDSAFASNHTFLRRCEFVNGTRIYDCHFHHLFAYTHLSDTTVGWIVLIASIFILVFCLVAIVYLIQRLLHGHTADYVRNLLNSHLPGRLKPLTGYIVMTIGLFVTVLVQSNSIFSSSLTPLVGAGVITLEQVYPLTLGSNIGTTFGGVLAALSADGSRFEKTLHMAMAQVIYNVLGVFIFYIIPVTRKLPIHLSRKLGEITERYRWFIVVFILFFFVILPGIILGLTLLPPFVIVVFFTIVFGTAAAIGVIELLQLYLKDQLPEVLQNWDWVPYCLRSLEPYDSCMTGFFSSLPWVGAFFVRPPEKKSKRASDSSLKLEKLVELSRNSHV